MLSAPSYDFARVRIRYPHLLDQDLETTIGARLRCYLGFRGLGISGFGVQEYKVRILAEGYRSLLRQSGPLCSILVPWKTGAHHESDIRLDTYVLYTIGISYHNTVDGQNPA